MLGAKRAGLFALFLWPPIRRAAGGIAVSDGCRSCYSSPMKIAVCFLIAALAAAALFGCRDVTRLTILFTGDERGWIVPAG
jgi:hypothetical protein